MNCRAARRLLPLHCGRDLPPRRAAAVEAHLEACPACRAEAARWDSLRRELRAARPAAVTASGTWERIAPRLDAIDAAARLRRPWYRRPAGRLAAAAVLLGAVATGLWLPREAAPGVRGAGLEGNQATVARAGAPAGAEGLVRVPPEELEEFLDVQAALVRPAARDGRPFVQVVPVAHRVGEF